VARVRVAYWRGKVDWVSIRGLEKHEMYFSSYENYPAPKYIVVLARWAEKLGKLVRDEDWYKEFEVPEEWERLARLVLAVKSSGFWKDFPWDAHERMDVEEALGLLREIMDKVKVRRALL